MENKICPVCGIKMSLIHSKYIGNCVRIKEKTNISYPKLRYVQNN